MSKRERLWRWLPVVIWAAVIFLLSSRPGSDFPSLGFAVQKGFHVAEYALLAVLLFRALSGEGWSAGKASLVAWLLTVLYAGSDELHQLFVNTRNGSIVDVGIDAIGAILGITFARLVQAAWLGQRNATE
jgi:VanZ family protein